MTSIVLQLQTVVAMEANSGDIWVRKRFIYLPLQLKENIDYAGYLVEQSRRIRAPVAITRAGLDGGVATKRTRCSTCKLLSDLLHSAVVSYILWLM